MIHRVAALILLVPFLANPPMVAADGPTFRGHVYLDDNNNGRRDKEERGPAKVAVTDGIQHALTDADGHVGFKRPFAAKMPVSITLFAGGGEAEFRRLDYWTLRPDTTKYKN